MNSNVENLNDTTTPTTNGAQRGHGQHGRGAAQRNQDKLRAKHGAIQNAENRRRIEERCFLHLTELSSQFDKIEVTQVKVDKQLPITTRALGFLTGELYTKAQTRVPNNNINIYEVYRASLLQFKLQVQKSYSISNEAETPPRPMRQENDDAFTYEQIVLSRPRNFLPLTSIINSYGHFVSYNSIYHPCFMRLISCTKH